jgi:hypothetical protein
VVCFLAEARNSSLVQSVQTGSGAHQALCSMDIGGSSTRVKAAVGVELTTYLVLVSRIGMEFCFCYSIHLHGTYCACTRIRVLYIV